MVKVGAVRGQEEDSFRGSELRQRGWNVWKMELPLPGDRETLRRCLKGELESVGDSTGPTSPLRLTSPPVIQTHPASFVVHQDEVHHNPFCSHCRRCCRCRKGRHKCGPFRSRSTPHRTSEARLFSGRYVWQHYCRRAFSYGITRCTARKPLWHATSPMQAAFANLLRSFGLLLRSLHPQRTFPTLEISQ